MIDARTLFQIISQTTTVQMNQDQIKAMLKSVWNVAILIAKATLFGVHSSPN